LTDTYKLGHRDDLVARQQFENLVPALPRPNLRDGNYRLTSEMDFFYNCIAWAAGENRYPWWPSPRNRYYWPITDRKVTIENFVAAFSTLGYQPCGKDGRHQRRYERIALYAIGRTPKHMARQLTTGRWTSKLGNLRDITHARAEDVEGKIYGRVVLYLRRQRQRAGQQS